MCIRDSIIRASTTYPTISISANRSNYTKIGRLVHANFDFSFTVTNAGSGSISIGLPFTVYGDQSYNGIHGARNNSAFSGIKDYEITGYGVYNDASIALLYSTGNSGAEAAINTGVLQNGRINFDFSYVTS